MAVVVGIDRYATRAVPDLTCAANDAESIATALRRTQPQRGLHLSVLMSPSRLEDARSPTHDGILRMLREAAEVAGEHDTVLFYFAGHGGMVEGRPCLLPADTPMERGDSVPPPCPLKTCRRLFRVTPAGAAS